MNKHVMAITYVPKIAPVRDGTCTQTIRTLRKKPIAVGDSILFHGWEVMPYRSPWSWRMRVVVTEAIPITLDWYAGIGRDDTGVLDLVWYPWDSDHANDLAAKDFIDPPDGLELRDVLDGLNGKMNFVDAQIIRW